MSLVKPGIHYNISFSDYRKIEAVNFSSLKVMSKSPKHFKHNFDSPSFKDTPAMLLGRATHTAVLEPDKFPLEYAVYRGEARRGKDWLTFKAANSDKDILKADEYDKCLAIRDAVRKDPVAGPLFEETGDAEVTIIAVLNGVLCKGRIDWATELLSVDLKTTATIDSGGAPGSFAYDAAKRNYHGQFAFYHDLRARAGEVAGFAAVVVENVPPYDVSVKMVTEHVLYSGRQSYLAPLQRVAACRKTGIWPGVSNNQPEDYELPKWAEHEDPNTKPRI